MYKKYSIYKWLVHSKKKSNRLPFELIDDINIEYDHKLPYKKLQDFFETTSYFASLFSSGCLTYFVHDYGSLLIRLLILSLSLF